MARKGAAQSGGAAVRTERSDEGARGSQSATPYRAGKLAIGVGAQNGARWRLAACVVKTAPSGCVPKDFLNSPLRCVSRHLYLSTGTFSRLTRQKNLFPSPAQSSTLYQGYATHACCTRGRVSRFTRHLPAPSPSLQRLPMAFLPIYVSENNSSRWENLCPKTAGIAYPPNK